MSRDLKDLVPEYGAGSETNESGLIKPTSPLIIESSSLDTGTELGTKGSPYDTGKPRRIVTRGKIFHEPQG